MIVIKRKSVIFLAITLSFFTYIVVSSEARSLRDARVMRPPTQISIAQRPIIISSSKVQIVQNAHHRSSSNSNRIEIEDVDHGNAIAYKPQQKPRKKATAVDPKKFRECIFFQLCPKAQCFNFGRFGACESSS